MIGYRGSSRYLADPELFALEVQALKVVRERFPNLWAMVPFVRTVSELEGVKALLKENRLEPGPDFKLWMMAEVPSNVLLLDKFLDTGVDGVSIGSNDLTQLVLGVDRDNEQLATMFDERDPAVLQAIEHVVTRCVARGVTVSICGQAPSVYPELTKKLVEWGATSVSVTPDMIDETRTGAGVGRSGFRDNVARGIPTEFPSARHIESVGIELLVARENKRTAPLERKSPCLSPRTPMWTDLAPGWYE